MRSDIFGPEQKGRVRPHVRIWLRHLRFRMLTESRGPPVESRDPPSQNAGALLNPSFFKLAAHWRQLYLTPPDVGPSGR